MYLDDEHRDDEVPPDAAPGVAAEQSVEEAKPKKHHYMAILRVFRERCDQVSVT